MLQLKYDMPMGTKKSDFGLSLVIIYVSCVNTLPASGDLCRPLKIFANGLDPDQNRQNVGPDLDPNCLHSDSVPERIFRKKVNFEKNQQTLKTYPACKELILGQ